MHRANVLLVMCMIASLIVAHAAFATDGKEPRNELLMGVAPIMSPEALFKRLSPLRNYLSSEMKQEVVIELNRNVDQLIERTDAGHYDMVFTGPNFAIRAFDSGLYVPGAIPGNLTSAVLIVVSSSPLKSIEELKGKVIATPRKKGAVSIIAPVFFRSNGFGHNEVPEFIDYASHNAAFMAVQNGDVDAAFIAEFGYRNLLSKNASASIRVIGRTKPFPGISMIVSSRLSDDVREMIINSIVNLGKSEKGKTVLRKISFPPFRRSSIKEFDGVRHYFNNKQSENKNGNSF